MPASVLPFQQARLRQNSVPQPKPKWCPAGYARCPECNRLVHEGETHTCHPETDTARPVFTRFDPNEIKGGQEPKKRKLKRLPDHRRKLYRRIRITTCEVCGCDFEHSSMGRTPAKCYDCRKK